MNNKMHKLVFGSGTATLLLSLNAAHAATSIECGTVNPRDTMELTNSLYEFSSEDDQFSGPVGKSWQMRIGKKWVKSSKKITAKTTKDSEGQILTIKEIISKGSIQTVGRIYEIKYLYTDSPILTIKNLGGVAGGVITNTLDCVGSYD